MANTVTTNKLFEEPAYGDTNWNTPLNINLAISDFALGSAYAISVGTGGTTALATPSALSSVPAPSLTAPNWWVAQQFTVTASGTLASNAIITIPAGVGGAWIVANNITVAQQATYTLTIKGVSGSGVTIAQGATVYIYCDGTNVYYTDTNLINNGLNGTFGLLSTTTENVGYPVAQTVTISQASPAIVTLPSTAAPVVNTAVKFSTTDTLPSPLGSGTIYYVYNPSGSTFNVVATYGGTSAIVTSTSGNGVHTATFGQNAALDVNGQVNITNAFNINNTPGTSGQYLTSGGAGTPPSWTTAAGTTGRLIRAPQYLTTPTNVTTPTTAASGTGVTATLTFAAKTAAPLVGTTIVVAGVTPTGYNGTYTITGSTTTTVSYASATSGSQTVAGTITFSQGSGIYTTPSNCTAIYVEMVGGGASGGKTDGSTSGGGGGGGGGYAARYFSGLSSTSVATTGTSGTGSVATITFASQISAPSVGTLVTIAGVTPVAYNGTYTVTASTNTSVSFASTTTGSQTVAGTIQIGTTLPFAVGAGGAGVSSSGSNGVAGGTTTLTASSTTVTASGGAAGQSGGAGGAGGTGTNGNTNLSGGSGSSGYGNSTAGVFLNGVGGSSVFGFGGSAIQGSAGINYGGGAAGVYSTASNGSAGANGVIRITEYT